MSCRLRNTFLLSCQPEGKVTLLSILGTLTSGTAWSYHHCALMKNRVDSIRGYSTAMNWLHSSIHPSPKCVHWVRKITMALPRCCFGAGNAHQGWKQKFSLTNNVFCRHWQLAVFQSGVTISAPNAEGLETWSCHRHRYSAGNPHRHTRGTTGIIKTSTLKRCKCFHFFFQPRQPFLKSSPVTETKRRLGDRSIC